MSETPNENGTNAPGGHGFRVTRLVGPILVGCEESQVVCGAFRDAGYEAYSCDLQPTRGNPEWHYQQDIMTVIPTNRWGLIISGANCQQPAFADG
jgi:hypothetical protein